jgi:prevent-host-death family protein
MLGGEDQVAKNVSVTEAEAHFKEWVREAEAGERVVITRHGKPVVALVPAREIENSQRDRGAGPEKGLASLAGGWEGSEELVERLAEFRRSRPRDTPDLD